MSTTTVRPSAIEALSTGLRGPVVRPEDPGYDEARTVYNAMIDRRPAAVARCSDVADVITTVKVVREHDVPLAVRGGGHSGPGLGVADGAVTIDLAGLRGITVDPISRTVRVDGGCTWGDVDHATHAFGLAVPSGIISTTGVGGLTLGGGSGHLTRRCGLTLDNLLAADVVLADGSFVHASADEHPDLFWALRGGGGNFGIVTSFQFRCSEVSTVVAGPVLYDVGDLPEVLRWYREALPSLPEELNGFFATMTVPPGPPFPEELWLRKVCGVMWCYAGPLERADEVLAPVRGFGTPLMDGIQEMPYPMLQGAFDGLYTPGLQWYWKADMFREVSDAAVAVHQKYGEVPTTHSTMHLYPVDGAPHRVGATDTAFPFRDAVWNGVIVGVDPDPVAVGPARDWARSYWEELHPYSAGGAYVNFLMDADEARVRASYGPNYERLTRIKATYDPTNLFRSTQNIRPATP